MKKLIICSMEHGHLELTDAVDIEREFKNIMKNGYGGKVPAVFHADFADGSHVAKKGKDAEPLLYDPNVTEVAIIPILVGG